MAKKKKYRAKRFANPRSGKSALPAASLASRLTRPVVKAPATESTYYLELADIALGGKADGDGEKKGDA